MLARPASGGAPGPGGTAWPTERPVTIRAVLFDRDGTLVDDVPYNGDPAKVRARPGARAAVDAVRARGLAVGVVTNQSGIGRGMLTVEAAEMVNERVDAPLRRFRRVGCVPPRSRPRDAGAGNPSRAWSSTPRPTSASDRGRSSWWATVQPTSAPPGPPGPSGCSCRLWPPRPPRRHRRTTC